MDFFNDLFPFVGGVFDDCVADDAGEGAHGVEVFDAEVHWGRLAATTGREGARGNSDGLGVCGGLGMMAEWAVI